MSGGKQVEIESERDVASRKTRYERALESPMRRPVPWIAAALTLGITVDRFRPEWTPDHGASWIFVGLAILAPILFGLERLGRKTFPYRWIRRLCAVLGTGLVLVAITVFGAAIHHAQFWRFPVTDIGLRLPEGAVAKVEGRVSQPPRTMTTTSLFSEETEATGFQIAVSGAYTDERLVPATGQLRVFVRGPIMALRRGDLVRVVGVRRGPYPPISPNEPNQVELAQAYRVLASLQVAHSDAVTLLSPDGDRTFYGRVDGVRNAAVRILRWYLGDEAYALAEAVLLGNRDDLSDEMSETFLRTGTVHLLSISGLHVGILAAMFFAVGRFLRLPIWGVWGGTLLGVVGYIVLTGAAPPAMRAGLFLGLICLSRHRWFDGRVIDLWFVTLIILLLLDPVGLFRIGFQYSFLCVGTILWRVRRESERDRATAWALRIDREETEPWYWRILLRWIRWARELLAISAWLWFVSAGLTLANFGQTAPGAIFSNLIAIPAMTVFVWMSFGVLVSAVCGLPGWWIHGWVWGCEGTQRVLSNCLEWVSEIPGAFVRLPPPPFWWLIGFHLLILFVVVCPAWNRRGVGIGRVAIPRGMILWCGWSVLGGILIFTPVRPMGLEVQFLAVGHGSATLIRFPDDETTPVTLRGRTLLYDCGSLGDPAKIAERIFRASWAWRIRSIDTVILSHADADHYNALPFLTEYFTIGEVVVGPLPLPDEREETPLAELKDTKTLDQLRELRHGLEAHRIPIQLVTEDTEIGEGVALWVFTDVPESGEWTESGTREGLGPTQSNANGLACSITWNGRSLLLTGDVEENGVLSLVDRLEGHVEIVAAPHHGSLKSRSVELMDRVSPDAVVVSCSMSDYREQTEDFFREYTDRVWFTWRCGSLYGVGDREGWTWSGWRSGKMWCTEPTEDGRVD